MYYIISVLLLISSFIANSHAACPGPQDRRLLDDAARSRVVGAIARELERGYVFPDVDKAMAAAIVGRAGQGLYGHLTERSAFAAALTAVWFLAMSPVVGGFHRKMHYEIFAGCRQTHLRTQGPTAVQKESNAGADIDGSSCFGFLILQTR